MTMWTHVQACRHVGHLPGAMTPSYGQATTHDT
jgi:hypothetical protein